MNQEQKNILDIVMIVMFVPLTTFVTAYVLTHALEVIGFWASLFMLALTFTGIGFTTSAKLRKKAIKKLEAFMLWCSDHR